MHLDERLVDQTPEIDRRPEHDVALGTLGIDLHYQWPP